MTELHAWLDDSQLIGFTNLSELEYFLFNIIKS